MEDDIKDELEEAGMHTVDPDALIAEDDDEVAPLHASDEVDGEDDDDDDDEDEDNDDDSDENGSTHY